MLEHDKSASSRDRFIVTELSPTAWQVQRRRRAEGEAPVLLGFIQQFGDVFEAMDVTRPLERTYVRAMASAVASITRGTVTQ